MDSVAGSYLWVTCFLHVFQTASESYLKMAKIVVISAYPESLYHFRGPLLSAFVDAGNEVFACGPETNIEVESRITRLGVIYHPIYTRRTSMNPFVDLRTLLDLVRFLRAVRPDIVLAYTMKPIVYGSIAARISRVPGIFLMIEGLGYAFSGMSFKQRALNILSRILYRLALKRSRRVFFLNPDDLSLFVDTGILSERGKAVLLNGTGVDLDFFKPSPIPGGKMVFLLMARLIREKGILEFIEAARRLRPRYPEATFQILGPLDTHPAAIKQADLRKWQREGLIQYLGYTYDVRPYISGASVYVLPTFYREGVPRSILEAMAMGRPVITTDSPGCRETVVDRENGFLIPVRDVPALVSAMERFLRDPTLVEPMGKRSRAIAEEKYDVRKVNAVMMEAMGLINKGHNHVSPYWQTST
jgi:glycosyltransferase involved in cell wall biosynthesis